MKADPTVLIVDDDIDLFCVAIGEIEPDGDCHKANDCREALEKLRTWADSLPDVIFVDLDMSGTDGRACL